MIKIILAFLFLPLLLTEFSIAQVEMSKFNPTLKLGGRIQSVLSFGEENQNDFNLRRLRINFKGTLNSELSYYMDIRNDSINKEDKETGDFSVGDAYISYQLKSLPVEFRFFRAKVDVSRSQTSSSKDLFYIKRAEVSDFAANFVNEARRSPNIQALGEIGDHLRYQVVAGDGLSSESFEDGLGNTPQSIKSQSFMTGIKVRYSPISNFREKKVADTYYGEGRQFEFGAGVFNTSNIEIENSSGEIYKFDRTLYNLELSFSYKNINLLSEYFFFDGVSLDIESGAQAGQSDGAYFSLEYILPLKEKIAPFFRVESWDRYRADDIGSDKINIAGVNWYLNKEMARVGAVYSQKQSINTDLTKERDSSVEVYFMSDF
jgi:hypothetical protein